MLDLRLGLHVYVRGRLVQDQDSRVGHRCSRECHELPLSGGEVTTALAHLRVITLRQPLDELVGADGARRVLHIRGARARAAEGDVVADRP